MELVEDFDKKKKLQQQRQPQEIVKDFASESQISSFFLMFLHFVDFLHVSSLLILFTFLIF